MRIRAVVRTIYGKKYRYITDRVIREAIENISGRKTISDSDVKSLEKLGIEVRTIDPEQKIEGGSV